MAKLRFNSKDKEILKYEVEYEEVFHLKNLYKSLYEWLKEEGYKSADGGEPEQLYFEIKQPDGKTFHHIWWRLYKDYHKFLRVFQKIDFQTLNMSSVEVMWKDKKTKTNKGDFVMRVQTTLQWDPNEEISNHWILKHFENWMKTRLYKKDYDNIKKAAESDGLDIREFVKQYLQIKGSDSRPKSFSYENRGLGD